MPSTLCALKYDDYRNSKTLLKKKIKKSENSIIKLEEQFDFMRNFNKEVRERNKNRRLKVPSKPTRLKRPKTKQNRSIYYTVLF